MGHAHLQAGRRAAPAAGTDGRVQGAASGPRLRPASRSAPSNQAYSACPVAPRRSRQAVHPRPGESSRSQRSITLCPPGSDQQIQAGGSPPAGGQSRSQGSSTLCPPGSDHRSVLADHHQPADSRAPSDQAHCACLVATQQIRAGRSPRPEVRRVPGDQARCARLVATSGSKPAGQPRPGERSRSQRLSTLCPPGGAHVGCI